MILPDAITQITQSIRLGPCEPLVGQGSGLSVLEVMTPGIDAVILDSGSPSEAPTRNRLEGFTIRTRLPGVTGVRGIGASVNRIVDIGFQGPAFTINLDRGLHNIIRDTYAEEFDGRPVGTLRIGSSDGTWYSHYTTIQAYQTRGVGNGWVAIFDRAANVNANFMVHEPGCDGFLITDDCQGLALDGFVVKAQNGVVLSENDGRKPSFVDLRRLNVDQSIDFGVRLHAGCDLDVGGQITNGNQGILVGGYPAVERVKIDARLATHTNNGIVLLPGARYWSVMGASACGTGGSPLVASNLDADDFTVMGNDFFQNGAGMVLPPAGPTRVIALNR